jgi:hypothetical protein
VVSDHNNATSSCVKTVLNGPPVYGQHARSAQSIVDHRLAIRTQYNAAVEILTTHPRAY